MLHICSEPPQEEEAKEEKKDGKLFFYDGKLLYDKYYSDKKDKKKDKKEKEKKDGRLNKQAVAVIGIALIAMGEDIGR